MGVQLPLVLVLLTYAGGLWFGDTVQAPVGILLALALIVWVAALTSRSMRQILLPPSIFLAGCAVISLDNSVLSPADLRLHLTGEPVIATVRGELVETPNQSFTADGRARWMARLRVTGLQTNSTWVPATGLILATTPGAIPPDLFSGELTVATGVLQTPPGSAAPGLFDYRKYLRRHHIYFQLRTSGIEDWHRRAPLHSPPLADRFIHWASVVFSCGLDDDLNLRLLRAMTLGERNEITAEVYEPFVRSGTMHVFAISGLHIAIVAGILIVLLNVARVPRAWSGAIVIPLIWAYTAATGWQPSAIRATIMMTVIVAGWAMRRPGNVLNSLATSGLLILLWDPQQLFQASFQLSFCVVLVIVLLVPRIYDAITRHIVPDPFLPGSLLTTLQHQGWKTTRWMLAYSGTSAAAWLGVLPLTAAYFNLFSPVTFVANLFVVPLSNAALACNFASLCCGTWFSAGTELFNNAAWLFMEWMVKLSTWAAAMPSAIFNVPRFGAVEVLGYYGLLVCLAARAWQGRGRLVFAGYCTGLGILFGVRLAAAALTDEVTILAKSGSAIVHARSGLWEDSLVDAGRSNTVQFVTLPYLKAQGVNRLDALFLTHGDLQHVEGAPWVAQAFQAEKVCTSGLRFRSRGYRSVMEALGENVAQVHAGDRVCGWEVLHPEAGATYSRADDGALCIRRQLGGMRLLYLGDLGGEGQEALLNNGRDLRAEVLVTGLPGQGSPVNKGLLERIDPRIIIVADDISPSYERANDSLVARLSQRGVPVLRMSEEGAVIAHETWNGLRLRTNSGREFVLRR